MSPSWDAAMLAALVLLAELPSQRDVPYVVFPVLIWAALRFGQRGATLAVAVTAVVTVWNVTHYAGPFHFNSITRSVLSTQLFIAVAVLLAGPLPASRSYRSGTATPRP